MTRNKAGWKETWRYTLTFLKSIYIMEGYGKAVKETVKRTEKHRELGMVEAWCK